MANTGLVTLGSLRIQAQQRADMVNSGFITTPEWNRLLTSSQKELYDLLVTAYEDYNVAPGYNFVTANGVTDYALPDGLTTADSVSALVAAPFYKLLGLDLKVTSSPDSWVTLRPFMFNERNKFWQANQNALYGVTPMRYRVFGSNLRLTPVPSASQTIQMWYVPKPTNLQPEVVCATTSGSAVVTCTDTSQLTPGMNVADLILAQGATSVVQSGATISSVSAGVSFTMSSTATATQAYFVAACWNDTATIDDVAGWEEYVVIDAAMKAMIKEESGNFQELAAQKGAIKLRIEETAANRDAGIPARVSDTVSIDMGWPSDGGSTGRGGDF